MPALTRTTFIIAVLFSATVIIAPAQQGASEHGSAKEPTGSISGRITVSGKGAAGVLVNLRSMRFTGQRTDSLKARTDDDGRFRFDRLTAGDYRIVPITPTLVTSNLNLFGQTEIPVNVADGEAVEGINFALVRGGVITGRVTDDNGRPLIDKHVKLSVVDASGQKRADYGVQGPGYETDDRGVYRIYGLPAGRYLVSLGFDKDELNPDHSYDYGYYTRTFHPNVTDESKAKIIELSEGSEATGVDITLGKPLPTYSASGRIVDGDTGKPVANIVYGYGTLSPQVMGLSSVQYGPRANFRGEFRIEALAPGRFAIITDPEGKSDRYSDPLTFEITDRDISGLEVRLRRGGTIKGVAVIEGTSDEAILSQLSELYISTHVQAAADLGAPRFNLTKIAPDGSFGFSGLRPGKVNIYLSGDTRKGFSLLRVERDGIEQREGLEIEHAEQVTGVRVVIGYGTGVIRGEVKVKGGRLPENMRFTVMASAAGRYTGIINHVEADPRGRFVIEDLTAGDYELTLQTNYLGDSSQTFPTDTMTLTQTVTVTNASATEATFVVDLNAGSKPQ